ncbi:MAG: hypothetical protein RUDDFDWM_001491, partial [Candidatus Fervidibacterota bacterium]
GSSREHAALVLRYLGIRAVIAKSFSRIHCANLINFGVLPLTFINDEDYELIRNGDELELPDVAQRLREGQPIIVRNISQRREFIVRHPLTHRQVEVVLAGGVLNMVCSRSS